MAGNELVTEGFQPGQVGSSAMPHKMNTRSAERINGFAGPAARLRGDGRRAGRRPVERGRRVVLGRAPGRAARRLLRPGRHARDHADRARRVRRVPGRRSSASSTATCRSSPRPRCSWPPCAPASAARRRTRRSRRTRSRSRSRCARRAPSATTCSTGSPPTRGSGLSPTQLAGVLADPITFTGAARDQVAAVVAAVDAALRSRAVRRGLSARTDPVARDDRAR